jgi:predicted PurR-regulated permease PerM
LAAREARGVARFAARVTQTTIAVIIVLLAVWVARDFLVALTWAAVIAIACWPIYLRFARLVGRPLRSLAPMLFTLVIGLVLLVPIVMTVHQLAQGSEAFVRAFNRLRESGIAVPAWLAQLPVAGEYIEFWWRTNLGNPDVLVEWFRGVNVENLTAWTGTLGGALLHRLLLLAITLVALSWYCATGHGWQIARF